MNCRCCYLQIPLAFCWFSCYYSSFNRGQNTLLKLFSLFSNSLYKSDLLLFTKPLPFPPNPFPTFVRSKAPTDHPFFLSQHILPLPFGGSVKWNLCRQPFFSSPNNFNFQFPNANKKAYCFILIYKKRHSSPLVQNNTFSSSCWKRISFKKIEGLEMLLLLFLLSHY